MGTVSGRLKEWRDEKFRMLLDTGSNRVTDEHAFARIEICISCEKYGIVEPLPGMIMHGCTLCGCPSATKPYFEYVMRTLDKGGEPLSLEEFFRIRLKPGIKTFKEEIKCPHPDGNKWADIDTIFKTQAK